MKKFKSFVFELVLFMARLANLVFPPTKVLLATSDIPRSNMGDQALLLGAVSGLRKTYSEQIVIIPTGTETVPVELFPEFFSDIKIRHDLSIIWITEWCFWEKLKFALLLFRTKKVFYVGADILDGTYHTAKPHRKLWLLNKVKNAGVDVKVVSFSLSENIDPRCIKEYQKFSKDELCVRDPESAIRLNSFAECEIGADCAFLLEPTEFSTSIPTALKEWLSSQSKVIALSFKNTDEERFRANGLSMSDLGKNISKFARENHCSLLLIPHVKKDAKALNEFSKLLDKDVQALTYLDLLSAPQLKKLASKCSLVITGRMHFAIAALGQNTPILCIPYANKFEGLCKLFKLSNSVLELQSFCNNVEHTLKVKLNGLEEDKELIKANLPKIKKLALKAFR